MKISIRLPDAARTMLIQFFDALRFYFIDQHNISLSVDASRVGAKNRVLGFICRPDGYGGWLPPQDNLQYKDPHPYMNN